MRRTCYFIALLLGALSLFPPGAGVATAPPSNLELVTFPNPGPDVLARLAEEGWDIWEVTPIRVTAQLTPDQITALQMQGIGITSVERQLQTFVSFPQCYRTYEAAVTQLQGWAATYPTLTELIDAGPSWQTTQGGVNRRLWTLRITDETRPGPKPKILIAALHHAREIITPEVALNLAELLLTGYQTDADITWLVENREVWIVPFVNPDGHIFAEYSVDWRKNTNSSQGTCVGSSPPNSFGVDLNRNYGHNWAMIGASSNPCNLTYRGTGAFSEPETQAIRDLVQAEQFDLLLSLHSFGDLILYPWGYTYSSAPDAADLHNIASVLASFNGYAPQQSSQLYPTSGDTCDWAYGMEGIPCFTFEIGGAAEGYFWPGCKTAEGQWLENKDALLYAIKLAGHPYESARAPIVRDVRLQPAGRFLTVQAVLDREATSPEPPAGGEVFIDQPGAPGTGIPLTPDDQLLNTAVETMTARVDLSGLQGKHTLYVVGTQDDGQHGPPAAVYFEPCPDVTGDRAISADDVMQVAGQWRMPASDPTFDAALDLNGDDRIDVRDISEMAAQWGTTCN